MALLVGRSWWGGPGTREGRGLARQEVVYVFYGVFMVYDLELVFVRLTESSL